MATKSATVDITIVTDADKATRGFNDAATAADKLGSAVDDASRKVDTGAERMSGAADAADNLDSKSAQATGSLGALSSGFELVGADQYAAGLQSAALATDFMAGVGEGLNLILELQAVQWVKNKVATAASTAATIAQSAATKAAAAAQWAFNAAMNANPIALVVIAVVALIAGFVLLYKKSETFRRVVNALWAVVKSGAAAAARILKTVFGAVWTVLKTYVTVYWTVYKTIFNAIIATTKRVAALIKSVLTAVWTVVRSAFTRAWDAIKRALSWSPVSTIKSAWSGVKDVLVAPFEAAERLIKGIADGLSGVFSGVLDGLTGSINAVIRAINSAINAFNHLPGPDIPNIPELHSAPAPSPPGPAPLTMSRFVSPTLGRARATTPTATDAGTVVINFNSVVTDKYGVATEIARLLGRRQVIIGGTP